MVAQVEPERTGQDVSKRPIWLGEAAAPKCLCLRHDPAMRWIVGYAQARKNVPLVKALASELKEAANGQGNAIKKRDDTHKMAQANRAFAHYRW